MRDGTDQFVADSRRYLDLYGVESSLSDRLRSLHALQQLVNDQVSFLEQQVAEEQQRATLIGDGSTREQLRERRQRVAEVSVMFGLTAWLHRMADINPPVAQAMERLLGATDCEVFRVVIADCHSQFIIAHVTQLHLVLEITLPDSLTEPATSTSTSSSSSSSSSAAAAAAAVVSEKQPSGRSSFTLETNVSVSDNGREFDRGCTIRIPHSSIQLSAHARQQLGAPYEQRLHRQPQQYEEQKAEEQRRRAEMAAKGFPQFPPDFHMPGSVTRQEFDAVCEGVMQSDLEVLYFIATLFGFPRQSPAPPSMPAVGERMRREHWPFVVSAAEVLFLVLHLALPYYLHKLASAPAAADLDNQRELMAEKWDEAIREGKDCVLGESDSNDGVIRQSTDQQQQVQIPAALMRDSSFVKLDGWFSP